MKFNFKMVENFQNYRKSRRLTQTKNAKKIRKKNFN